MKIIYDPAKDSRNITERGLSFAMAELLDWEHAVIQPDDRFDYGEERYQAYGTIEGRLYMVAFTMRSDVMRIISFRKANNREVKKYG